MDAHHISSIKKLKKEKHYYLPTQQPPYLPTYLTLPYHIPDFH